MNQQIFNSIFSLSSFPIIGDIMLFISNIFIYVVFALFIVFIFFKKKNIILNLLLFIFIIGLTYLLSHILKGVFAIPRPFLVLPITPLFIESGFSFPSSHASVFMALVVFAFYLSKNFGFLILFFTLLIGLSRVVIGVHYPVDILGGFALGFIIGYFCIYVVEKLDLKDYFNACFLFKNHIK